MKVQRENYVSMVPGTQHVGECYCKCCGVLIASMAGVEGSETETRAGSTRIIERLATLKPTNLYKEVEIELELTEYVPQYKDGKEVSKTKIKRLARHITPMCKRCAEQADSLPKDDQEKLLRKVYDTDLEGLKEGGLHKDRHTALKRWKPKRVKSIGEGTRSIV